MDWNYQTVYILAFLYVLIVSILSYYGGKKYEKQQCIYVWIGGKLKHVVILFYFNHGYVHCTA